MVRDFEHRYHAVRSRDARFDGWFFVAVTSTGIYELPKTLYSEVPRTPLLCNPVNSIQKLFRRVGYTPSAGF